MIHLVLYQPEIPPNTGAIMRLATACGAPLHLIEPLGFTLSDKTLKRSGMDYRERTQYWRHRDWQTCQEWLNQYSEENEVVRQNRQIYALSTKAHTPYTQTKFNVGDVLLFGPESRGLPATMLESFEANHQLKIPMREGERSLNLAMSVAIVTYEALRQVKAFNF